MVYTQDRILTSTNTNLQLGYHINPSSCYKQGLYTSADEMSDSDSSHASPSPTSQCFCGRQVVSADGGIYCSVDCARSDAFSSLCYKPTSFPQYNIQSECSSSSSSAPLSRGTSSASSVSADGDDWNASHYRRLARADIRKQERQDERRRRRADMSSRSTSSSTGVPDLIGGHSRNVSVASTASSAYTIASLSRNPSSASTASSRRFGNGVHIDTAIMEDEGEEWLAQPEPKPHRTRRRPSNAALSEGRLRQLEAFGMGKDMRDVLEEIIQMEKGFSLSDAEEGDSPAPGVFTAAFDRPPRTPSPMAVDKRSSIVPVAPGAPMRGHRVTQSFASAQTPRRMGHQSSLSESHTALYLATASPAGPGRRSISPKLQARTSLTFTPDKAGPSIGALRPPRFDSPGGATPSRRRGNNSPGMFHPTMDGWKFPTTGSNNATPTRPPPINTTNLPGNFATPVNSRHHAISPQLLWPASSLPPPLAPALFPSSPAVNTPDFAGHADLPLTTPHSGLRLGVLLGSGDDVEMDDDDSTAHGHEALPAGTGYLPVFLQAEGFQGGRRWA